MKLTLLLLAAVTIVNTASAEWVPIKVAAEGCGGDFACGGTSYHNENSHNSFQSGNSTATNNCNNGNVVSLNPVVQYGDGSYSFCTANAENNPVATVCMMGEDCETNTNPQVDEADDNSASADAGRSTLYACDFCDAGMDPIDEVLEGICWPDTECPNDETAESSPESSPESQPEPASDGPEAPAEPQTSDETTDQESDGS